MKNAKNSRANSYRGMKNVKTSRTNSHRRIKNVENVDKSHHVQTLMEFMASCPPQKIPIQTLIECEVSEIWNILAKSCPLLEVATRWLLEVAIGGSYWR